MTLKLASLVLLVAATALGFGAGAWRPRALPPEEVPVAFWAWQTRAPRADDVRAATSSARATPLFLRAGQLDLANGRVRRLRPVEGPLPGGVELHVVYNATGALLEGFERVEPAVFAAALAAAVGEDLARAAGDGAHVAGVQLDLDAPTRLLGHYEKLLRVARAALPSGTSFSITGLPTWMESPALVSTLDAVDFWVPQCYGSEIPDRVERALPIATPADVARDVAHAEALGRPYWAGLAAYGYAVHYARDGRRLEVRGDLDPAAVARVVNLDVVERRELDGAPGAWRVVYRATAPCAVDGLALERGETLILDVPSGEWLRLCARAVRERGGRHLAGICVFRLPSTADATTLTLDEVRAAVEDREARPGASVRATRDGDALVVEVTNAGTASATPGDGALVVDVRVGPGTVRSVDLKGFTAADMLAAGAGDVPRPSSSRRADVVRLGAGSWRPGERLRATLRFVEQPPPYVDVELASQPLGQSPWRDRLTVAVEAR